MNRKPLPSIYRFTVSEYSNRKGEPRASVLMSRWLAEQVAIGNDDAIIALSKQIETAIAGAFTETERAELEANGANPDAAANVAQGLAADGGPVGADLSLVT